MAENGSSKGRFMKTWPRTCATSTLRPPVAVKTRAPGPGAAFREVQRTQHARLLVDELEHVALVEGVIAQCDARRRPLKKRRAWAAESPAPEVAFSPLTTTKSSRQSALQLLQAFDDGGSARPARRRRPEKEVS
jgi:hypothetical protein